MAIILKSKSLYYNDVNIISNKVSQISSRKEVPLELNRLIISPMAALVGKTFALEASKLGLTVCLHRFLNFTEQAEIYLSIPEEYRQNIYCSIGLNDDYNRFIWLYNKGCRKFCLDIALGTHRNIASYLRRLSPTYKIDGIILGNIHSKEGCNYLIKSSLDAGIKNTIIRCGIGGGVACKSSDTVGVNRGNITEIIECSEESDRYETISICADGGLHKGANFCKAFGAGASYCMSGGFWMQSLEAESNLTGDGSYWGGASDKQQILYNGAKIKHSEGKEINKLHNNLRPLKEIVNELWGNISSFVSYNGNKTLTEAIGSTTFEIKQNSLPPKNRY